MKKMTNTQISDYDVVISVDVGVSGGISFFDVGAGELLSVYPMPTTTKELKTGKSKKVLDLKKLRHILEIPKLHKENAIVILENLHAFPGQGVVAIASLMEQFGVVRGMSEGLGYESITVEPKTWQKYFNLIPPKDIKGKSASQTKALRKKWLKQESLGNAKERFPNWEGGIGDSDGIADSLLIGYWYLSV